MPWFAKPNKAKKAVYIEGTGALYHVPMSPAPTPLALPVASGTPAVFAHLPTAVAAHLYFLEGLHRVILTQFLMCLVVRVLRRVCALR